MDRWTGQLTVWSKSLAWTKRVSISYAHGSWMVNVVHSGSCAGPTEF